MGSSNWLLNWCMCLYLAVRILRFYEFNKEIRDLFFIEAAKVNQRRQLSTHRLLTFCAPNSQ